MNEQAQQFNEEHFVCSSSLYALEYNVGNLSNGKQFVGAYSEGFSDHQFSSHSCMKTRSCYTIISPQQQSQSTETWECDLRCEAAAFARWLIILILIHALVYGLNEGRKPMLWNCQHFLISCNLYVIFRETRTYP